MPDEIKNDDAVQSPETGKQEIAEPKVILSGSTFWSALFAIPIFLTILTVGLLNILAATGVYNPLHWDGRLWTGVFLIAAPGVMALIGSLPAKVLEKMPDSVAEVTILLVWVAFFWAACGGH